MPRPETDKLGDLRPVWERYKRHGDLAARNELVLRYVPLVKYVVGRVIPNLPAGFARQEYEDLLSVGTVGLFDALERFNPDSGVKFKTYAVSRIQGQILDDLRARDRATRSVREGEHLLAEVVGKLENELGRSASHFEIAEAMQISPEELDGLLVKISRACVIPLQEVLNPNSDKQLTLEDITENRASVDPSKDVWAGERTQILERTILRLPEKERIVIILYYYEELTLKEISVLFGVTESRVCQLHVQAIARLRGALRRLEPELV